MLLAPSLMTLSFSSPEMLRMDDFERALTKLPRSHMIGSSIPAMLAKMNKQLTRAAPTGMNLRPCEEWSLDDLTSLLTQLHQARDPAFDEIYHSTADNRRMRAGATSSSQLEELAQAWAADEEAAVLHGEELISVARDSRCYDAVMWWVHHVPE